MAPLGGGSDCDPNASTYFDRTIDFFVVSAALAHMVAGIHVVGDALGKPHWPVRLLMNGKARPCLTRVLKVPTVFGAMLPFGPAVKPPAAPLALQEGGRTEGDDARPKEELAKDYNGFLERLETELALIAGLEG